MKQRNSYTKRHPEKEDTKAEKSWSHWKLKDQNLERTLGNHGGNSKADLSDYRLRVITGSLSSACFNTLLIQLLNLFDSNT